MMKSVTSSGKTIRENPGMYKQIVKSIPGGADYFQEQWEKDFGTIIDVSTFSDEK